MSVKKIKLVFTIGASIVGFFIFLTVLLSLPLRWFNPPVTAFVFNDDNVGSLNLRDKWAAYDEVSPHVFLAVMAAEDQKFPEHFGFDFESLKKALNEKRSKRRGASTITQQLVKNVYLWPGRSLFRKGVEAWLTLWIELFVSKERILELYVNVVEFGPGIYGVGKATETFYGTKPKSINRFQAAMLASVLPNPKRYSVAKPSAYVFERSADIRRSMRALGGVGFLSTLE
ncbi:MAG: monofunctional biosynthetic peptidoglycan transglycosylase [Cellvibrionaceae bacterium]